MTKPTNFISPPISHKQSSPEITQAMIDKAKETFFTEGGIVEKISSNNKDSVISNLFPVPHYPFEHPVTAIPISSRNYFDVNEKNLPVLEQTLTNNE